jgi:hypothetical protein
MTDYDFFISYKWDKFSGQAKELLDIARSRGFTAWLDVEHPFQKEGHGSIEALAAHLMNGLESCRYILFFETFAIMAKQVGGLISESRVGRNANLAWQIRRNSSHSIMGLLREVSGGTSTKVYEYRELTDAFTMIETAITDTASYFWAREKSCASVSKGRPIMGSKGRRR